MPTTAAPRRKHGHTHLFIAASAAEAWSGAIQPWCERVGPLAWQGALPSLVVVPTQSHVVALRQKAVGEIGAFLGLRFVTPPVLRELITAGASARLPLREHLRLLLAIAAEQVLRDANEATAVAAKAVARAPDHLLRTLDRFEAAGWNFDALELDGFRPIVTKFREQLRACGFDLIAKFDRSAAKTAARDEPLFADVLIAGFDGAHWPYWPLLQAAVDAAEQATIVLEYPAASLTDADSCWIGSWEEKLGAAQPVAVGRLRQQTRSDSLFSEDEMRGLSPAATQPLFAVGTDATEQARAIVALCLRFLGETSCTRIGIVFPAAGPLSRLVTNELSRREIHHNDSFGRATPGLFESPEWRAWLQLQRAPRLKSLLHFLNALPNRDELFPSLGIHRFDRTLHAAFSEILIDDVFVLLEFCATAGADQREIATALGVIGFLPAKAKLREFLAATKRAFAKLGWSHQWLEISRSLGNWTEQVDAQFPLSLFLRWLDEVATTFTRARDEFGDQPYATIQLLTVPQAVGQEWSHLILAGLNEGSWPPPETAEFARDSDIQEFNRTIRKLNRRAVRQGIQGEGHSSVAPDRSLYLGPAEQRQIAIRHFETLTESASAAIAVTASLVQDAAPERVWNPSELLTRLYLETHGQPLTQNTMRRLQTATADWLRNNGASRDLSRDDASAVAQTRAAYDARRDATQQSGEYDFALRKPISPAPVLSVSEFDRLISAPALVWMKHYLGVEAEDDDRNPWLAASGQWVHRWLANIAASTTGEFAAVPSSSEIDERICAAAFEKRDAIERLCTDAAKAVPDWWKSGWQNALCLARHLGSKLATIDDWPWMAAEWVIDGKEAVNVSSDATLVLRGRIDLILAQAAGKPTALRNADVWILDYKTGSSKKQLGSDDVDKRKARIRKQLLDGSALQLALYGFAVRAGGANSVALSLISPAVAHLAQQLSLNDFGDHSDIFEELARMQQSGVFGMHGLVRSAWSFNRAYPLATLAIDNDVVEDRWERTHPPLVRDEEEFSW